MTDLNQRVALVTGASRGVGRGVALGLAHAGATVFATGRRIEHADLGAGIITIACDHTDDEAVAGVFRRIDNEAGRLDILVNVAWGGYERMVEEGRFTWAAPFWEQPAWRWDAMVTAGVRAAFVASQHAARRMVAVNRGLIVHVSSWAAQKYGGNVVYGLAKAATDRMASDMAHQLQPHGVTVVSLYPGWSAPRPCSPPACSISAIRKVRNSSAARSPRWRAIPPSHAGADRSSSRRRWRRSMASRTSMADGRAR
jgi:NAD(P)-dependent dehydrogenase (short-subunit alcohol dehydrogenase family)